MLKINSPLGFIVVLGGIMILRLKSKGTQICRSLKRSMISTKRLYIRLLRVCKAFIGKEQAKVPHNLLKTEVFFEIAISSKGR